MLRLAETFTSIQGEGHLVGKRMHFVRLAGCSVTQCGMHPSWAGSGKAACDTDFSTKITMSPEDVAAECLKAVGPKGWVCITGGEPCDQPQGLAELGILLERQGQRICLQTSGTRKIPIKWDWVSLSPKGAFESLRCTFGQELKFIYRGQPLSELRRYYDNTRFWDYYLQPFWHPQEGPNTEQTIKAVHEACDAGMDWKLSTQSHKSWGVR